MRIVTLILFIGLTALAANTARHLYADQPAPLNATASQNTVGSDLAGGTVNKGGSGVGPSWDPTTEPEPDSIVANPPLGAKGIEDRFVVKGDIPQAEVDRIINRLKTEEIAPDDPEITQLNQTNQDATFDLNQAPSSFSDPYCPYNKTKAQQCGGAQRIEQLRHTQCTWNTRPGGAFDYSCNYGNYPNILDPMGSLHPKDPNPECLDVRAPPICFCLPVFTPPCGVITRTYMKTPTGCVLLPETCEQCCAGSAWLYDSVTAGCSCGVGP